MKRLIGYALACVLANSALQPAHAGDKDPLFINLTTDEGDRVMTAIGFGKNQLERGHPLTLFLDDKGVLLAAKSHANKYPDQQKVLAELISKGTTIIVCGACMHHNNVQETDLLPGVKKGNPVMTGDALFKDNTKTLSW